MPEERSNPNRERKRPASGSPQQTRAADLRRNREEAVPGHAHTDDRSAHGEPDAFSRIRDLAQHSTSRRDFYRHLLDALAPALSSPFALIYVRLSSEVVQEEYHFGPTDPGFWRPPLHAFLTESLAAEKPRARVLSARQAVLKIALISAPILDADGGVIGTVAMVTPLGDLDASVLADRLSALTTFASHVCVPSGHGGSAGGSATGPSDASRGQALGRSAAYESVEELAFSLTNNLRNKTGCRQVALARVLRHRCRILAISGLDEVKRRSPGVVRIHAAMEECLDIGRVIVCQDDARSEHDELSSGYRLHKQWHDSTLGAAVASMPLFIDDRCVAVISLCREAEKPFQHEELENIRTVVAPFAPAIELVHLARRRLVRHSVETVRGAASALVGRGHWRAKLGFAAAAALVAWICCGTLPYRVTAPCVMQPIVSRVVTAPYDGVVGAVAVNAGDRVAAGDLLCELDHRELDLQRDQIEAELAMLEQKRTRALAERKPAEARLVEAEQTLVKAKLGLVTRRIERSRVTSPISGVVVSGDLRSRVMGVVKQGERLFEVAPPDQWRVLITVPERLSSDLTAGLAGRFTTRAKPEESHTLTLDRVRPTAEMRDGKNVVIIEADARIHADWLRPEMEGTAQIDAGRRPVWMLLSKRLLDYLRLNYWL